MRSNKTTSAYKQPLEYQYENLQTNQRAEF